MSTSDEPFVVDEEEFRKTGKVVFKGAEARGSFGVASAATRVVAQSGDQVRGKPAKTIKHVVGRGGSYSLIITRTSQDTSVLQIAWKKDQTSYISCDHPKPMGKSRFEVGEREKHSLTVDTDRVMKTIRIEVDGQKVIDESLFSPGAKKFAFDVGSSEVHKVEVNLGMTRWAFGRKITVLVDGKPVQSTSAGK